MKKKITYTDEPMDNVKIIPDFLPSPDKLVLKPVNANRVLISIDSDIVEIFKSKAGNRDFQQLINETLRKAVAA